MDGMSVVMDLNHLLGNLFYIELSMWGKMHGREEKAQVLQNGISCSEKNMVHSTLMHKYWVFV
jgi:hypothetical protein